MKEVSLYDYLDYDEANELVEILDGNNIFSRRHGMASGDGITQDIYQVLINHSDIERASLIADRYRTKLKNRRFELLIICPKCKSRPPITHTKMNLSWWRKILSTGTTVMECDNCGTIWYI